MRLQQVTGPVIEPMTLTEAKLALRVDTAFTADDSYIGDLISSAREYIEQSSHRKLITQTWDLFLDCLIGTNSNAAGWSSALTGYYGTGGAAGNTIYNNAYKHNVLVLPHSPVQSVTWFKYYDTGGYLQTWDSANYIANPGSPGRVAPLQSIAFPSVASQIDCINIRYVAGFGDAESNVPYIAKQLIYLMVNHYYFNRLPVVTGTISSEIAMTVDDGISLLGIGANLFA